MTSLRERQKGFTLVELLVVVAIIAILTTIGITVFTITRQSARDAKRRADIQTIAKTLENNFVEQTPFTCPNNVTTGVIAGSYCPLQNLMFQAGVPQDPLYNSAVNPTTGQRYCMWYSSTAGAIIQNPAAWSTPGACPTTTVAGTNNVTGTVPAVGTTPPVGQASWRICALMELGTGANKIFCLGNRN